MCAKCCLNRVFKLGGLQLYFLCVCVKYEYCLWGNFLSYPKCVWCVHVTKYTAKCRTCPFRQRAAAAATAATTMTTTLTTQLQYAAAVAACKRTYRNAEADVAVSAHNVQ